jgi:hypothetical protein
MLHRVLDFSGFFGTIYANGTHGTSIRALLSLQWLEVGVLHTRQQNAFL